VTRPAGARVSATSANVSRPRGRQNKALQLSKRGGGSWPVWSIVINVRFAAERQCSGDLNESPLRGTLEPETHQCVSVSPALF
jgi:hypothetical protein